MNLKVGIVIIIFMDLDIFGVHGLQYCSRCDDHASELDWISMVANKMGSINLIHDSIYEYPARYIIENRLPYKAQLQVMETATESFATFLHTHLTRVLLMSSISAIQENLNFVLLCNIQTVNLIIKQAEEADKTMGMRSLLRHFSKWLILLGEPTHLLTDTVFDHVTTASITDLKCLGELCSGKQEECCEHNDTTNQVRTLLWGLGGREWAPVNTKDLPDHQLLSALFPNIRNGLNGRQLSLTLLEWLPMSKRLYENGTIKYVGAGIDIVDKLSMIFNCSYTFVEPADQQWGSKIGNSSWTGIVGMLQRQEADLCPVDYAINYERAKVMDISIPIMQLYRVAVYKKSTNDDNNWLLLVACFQWQVYLCGLVVLLWMVLLFNIIRHILRMHGCSNSYEDMEWAQLYLSGPFRQGMKRTPRSCSLRTLLGAWCVSCVIVTAVFSGELVALATVETHTVPFKTLLELADQGEYAIGAQAGEYAAGIFKMSQDSVYNTLWNKIQASMEGIAKEDQDDMTYHRSRVLEEKYVLITTSMILETMETDTCDLVAMRERFLPSHSGLAFPRNSPLLKLFNQQLLSFVEEGLIKVWVKKWTATKKQCFSDTSHKVSEFKPGHMLSVFVTCAVCIAIATMVLLSEILWAGCKPMAKGKTTVNKT